MTAEQAEKFRYNILDLTKVWPHKEYPLRPVGKIVLNKNVENYFAEIEQAAFSPSHLVPGIEPSADPVLQSRLFSYPDTHRCVASCSSLRSAFRTDSDRHVGTVSV